MQYTGATLIRLVMFRRGSWLILLSVLNLLAPCDLSARSIKPREWALQRFDKSIDLARRSINDARTLGSLLGEDFPNIMDHPEVFKMLEMVVIKSTSPACVSLALHHLAYSYYDLEEHIDVPPRSYLPGAHSKETRRRNTLRLLKHALDDKSLWVRMRAAKILSDRNLRELKGKNAVYPVVVKLAFQEDWERRIEEDGPGLVSTGWPPTDRLKQMWAADLIEALVRYDTPEARAALRQAWHKTRMGLFVEQELKLETSAVQQYPEAINRLKRIVSNAQKQMEKTGR